MLRLAESAIQRDFRYAFAALAQVSRSSLKPNVREHFAWAGSRCSHEGPSQLPRAEVDQFCDRTQGQILSHICFHEVDHFGQGALADPSIESLWCRLA